MSYYFKMYFKEITEAEILKFANLVVEDCKRNADEIIGRNIFYVPSFERDVSGEINKEDKRIWKTCDRYWLYKLFSVWFVFWPEKNLLGIAGNLSCDLEKSLKAIEFQNSTDQDYNYEEWEGISYFESVVSEFKDADKAKLLECLNAGDCGGYHESDINDLEYFRKSCIYETIYNELELNEWLYRRTGNFIPLKLECIRGIEDEYKMAEKLEKIKLKYVSE